MIKKYKLGQLLLAIVIVIQWIGPSGAIDLDPGQRLHPMLSQLASQEPDRMISVIVQKTTASEKLEAQVARLGGEITKHLPIINAFAARMRASSALRLAQEPTVRWVSPDAPIESTGRAVDCERVNCPPITYLDTLGVRETWNLGLNGRGIGVVVVDSGISNDDDFITKIDDSSRVNENEKRILAQKSLNPNSTSVNDFFGHGTYIAGIIGGNGNNSKGFYSGVAPEVNLISLKISDDFGMAYESDTVNALQWIYDNKDQYNIRVVNLSINATLEQSYHLSPLDAAAEILWFNGIVVVASAGNTPTEGGTSPINAAPANDPFIITVGASDEHGTASKTDDTVTNFSAFGTTQDGFIKPDIIAPGRDIISVLSKDSSWDVDYPQRSVDGEYFRLSGTSAAAPMVTGAVALLLQDEPELNPDQVKYRLLHTAGSLPGADDDLSLYPYLNVYIAVSGTTTETANTRTPASELLWTGTDPVNWDSVNWNSVNWASVNWASVNWASVNWASVNWASVSWDD